MDHRALSPSLTSKSRTTAVPALVAALVFASVTVVVSLWASASTARACTQPEPVTSSCPVPALTTAEAPREWRWDPPTTSFDDMVRTVDDGASRR